MLSPHWHHRIVGYVVPPLSHLPDFTPIANGNLPLRIRPGFLGGKQLNDAIDARNQQQFKASLKPRPVGLKQCQVPVGQEFYASEIQYEAADSLRPWSQDLVV